MVCHINKPTVQPPEGQGKLEVRQRVGPTLLNWAQRANVALDPTLLRTIEEGFPNDDAFDATIGLFGILEVLMKWGSGEPDNDTVRKLECSIFGHSCEP